MLNAEKYKEKIESNKDSKLACYIAKKNMEGKLLQPCMLRM